MEVESRSQMYGQEKVVGKQEGQQHIAKET
jgi:hypothetical protein